MGELDNYGFGDGADDPREGQDDNIDWTRPNDRFESDRAPVEQTIDEFSAAHRRFSPDEVDETGQLGEAALKDAEARKVGALSSKPTSPPLPTPTALLTITQTETVLMAPINQQPTMMDRRTCLNSNPVTGEVMVATIWSQWTGKKGESLGKHT